MSWDNIPKPSGLVVSDNNYLFQDSDGFLFQDGEQFIFETSNVDSYSYRAKPVAPTYTNTPKPA